jgi:TPR repeat protein
MTDEAMPWDELQALGRENDLEGALALGAALDLDSNPLYVRYIAWLHWQRGDVISSGHLYAKALALGDHEAEAEFQTCLQHLYRGGLRDQASALANLAPMSTSTGALRNILHLQFAAQDRAGLRELSQRLGKVGDARDARYAGEVLLYDGDVEAAFPFLSRAAELGDPRACQLLGEMYYQGKGVSKNDAEATTWYRAAAKHGFILSRSRLAHLRHSQNGARIDVVFILQMIGVMSKALWLLFLRPDDPRLDRLPK